MYFGSSTGVGDFFKRDMIPKITSSEQLKLLFKINSQQDINEFVKDNNQVYLKHKKNGEIRYISSPSDHLKAIQKWIVDNILCHKDYSNFAHAYTKERSIFTNARQHIGNRTLLKMDINNFFDSISFSMVNDIFISLGYSSNVSYYLTHLCTYRGYVRQGFVSSPIISNIILTSFDFELNQNLIKDEYRKFDFKYTRYSDDITISSRLNSYSTMREIRDCVSCLLEERGFKVNQEKTKVIKGYGPKIVTGIVVKANSISVPNKYKKQLLKELYFCEKFGVQSHLIYTGQFGKINFIEYLEGIANFIRNTDIEFYKKVMKRIGRLDIDC